MLYITAIVERLHDMTFFPFCWGSSSPFPSSTVGWLLLQSSFHLLIWWRVSLISFTTGQITCKNDINILLNYIFQGSPVIDWFPEQALHNYQTLLPIGSSSWTLPYRICIYLKLILNLMPNFNIFTLIILNWSLSIY